MNKRGRKPVLGEDAESITARISKEKKHQIAGLIKDGKYKDFSEFVRKAIDDRLGLEWLITSPKMAQGEA